MEIQNPGGLMFHALVGVVLLVVAGVARLWIGRYLSGEQWEKIGTRVEAGVLLGLVAMGIAVTLYYHFAD